VDQCRQRGHGSQSIDASRKEAGQFLGSRLSGIRTFREQYFLLRPDVITAEADIHHEQCTNAHGHEEKCFLLQVHVYLFSSIGGTLVVGPSLTSTGTAAGLVFSCQTLSVYFPGGTSLMTNFPSLSVRKKYGVSVTIT